LIGLSFLVCNAETKEVVFFTEKKFNFSTTPDELLTEVESIISENNELQGDFKEVVLIYTNPIYTLVPQILFDETKASEYLKFNSKILVNDYIANDVLELDDIVVVYVPFINVNNFFFERYGSFSYYHGITILLKSILATEKYSIGPKVFLHFQKGSFDCLILKDGKLELCNSYHYKTPEDFIYYTLFSLEQLKLNPETVTVKLLGDIKEDDENYKMAFRYIRNIEFMKKFGLPLKLTDNQLIHNDFILKNS